MKNSLEDTDPSSNQYAWGSMLLEEIVLGDTINGFSVFGLLLP